MEVKFTLNADEYRDLTSYCNLNDLLISKVVKDSFATGFNIERYGLLNSGEKVVEKEVIKEIVKTVEVPVEKEVVRIEYIEVEKPVEKIVEKEVIKEIIKTVEVPVEKVVIKEVPIEKVVEKIIEVSDDNQINELLLKIQQLENTPPKVVEVVKEVPVEIIKEVVIEKQSDDSGMKSKLDALQNTVQKLKQDNIEKDRQLKEYEKTISEIQKFQDDRKALFLKGSNLDDKLYK
jgi:hypothetical protein